MTDDLIAHTLAAITEVEEVARDAMNGRSGVWVRTGSYVHDQSDDVDPVVYDEGRPTEDEAEHIALHDPAAVLRRCAADRVLLDIVRHVMPHDGAAISQVARIVIRQIADGYAVPEVAPS